jgi:hypothetical protein
MSALVTVHRPIDGDDAVLVHDAGFRMPTLQRLGPQERAMLGPTRDAAFEAEFDGRAWRLLRRCAAERG